MKKFLQGVMKFLLGFLIYQVVIRVFRRSIHFPAPYFITKLLNSRWRERIQPADQVLSRSRVSAGKKVLEVGCGGGFLLPAAARRVGENGKVYALDISPRMLEIAKAYLAEKGMDDSGRVEFKLASAYDLPFDENTLDVVYYSASLMEIPEPLRALKDCFRVLRSGGTVSVTELLPDPDYPGMHVTAKLLKEAEFKIIDLEGNFFNYTVTAVKL